MYIAVVLAALARFFSLSLSLYVYEYMLCLVMMTASYAANVILTAVCVVGGPTIDSLLTTHQ